MNLTDEQRLVVESGSRALRVVAFAGAGKTSTLKAYAQARPSKRLLYLAFNSSIKKEAASKFPPNVVCMTTHSLAYRALGSQYRHKLENKVRPNRIARVLGLNPRGQQDRMYARAALKAMDHYLASPYGSFEEFSDAEATLEEHPRDALGSAARLWEAMIDPANTLMPMLHDGYLKLFQLSCPVLNYDGILFDEAQDANPVTLAIIKGQSAPKVFVGDPHQQIYGFRRAENAMEDPVLTDTLFLTESFRFGAEIADVANGILSVKREMKRIVGGRRSQLSGTRAFLCRGNAALFTRAVSDVKQGRRFSIIGGADGCSLDLLHNMWLLREDRRKEISDDFILHFVDYEQLKKYADSGDERDLKAWARLIEGHSNPAAIPNEIQRVRQESERHAGEGVEALATAHKSKGLEFGEVELADDFPSAMIIAEPNPDARGNTYPEGWLYGPQRCPRLWRGRRFCGAVVFPVEEINLRYVAATRAETHLRKGALGVTPFENLPRYVKLHPDFVLVESGSELRTKGSRLQETRREPQFACDSSIPGNHERLFDGFNWLEGSAGMREARTWAAYRGAWPELSWLSFAQEARSARDNGVPLAEAGAKLMRKAGLSPDNEILRRFLTDSGLIVKDSLGT